MHEHDHDLGAPHGLGSAGQRGVDRHLQGMSARLGRRSLLVGSVTLLLAAGARVLDAAPKPTITVHKSPT
jgi:hypothetical protein